MKSVALGFSLEAMSVPIANLLPSRKIPEGLDVSKKYKQIRSSIEEIGLIEPLSITPEIQKSGNHMVLDGHVRMIALRELGHAEVPASTATTTAPALIRKVPRRRLCPAYRQATSRPRWSSN